MHGTSLFVGQARVLHGTPDGRVRVQLLGGNCATCTAEFAIPFRYQPVTGDVLQVLARAGECWVTGVVHGRGTSQLAFRGPIELHAAGALRLAADGGVRVEAPRVELQAPVVESEAETAVLHAEDSEASVRGAIDERAGSCERSIDGTDQVTAGRHETIAARVVKMDGSLLRLS